MFDIQKFAEDEEIRNYGDILDGATDETLEEDLPQIPAELEGIPTDIARDIMTKAAAKTETPAENPAPQSDSEIESSVPYKRFKEVIDKKNELTQQLNAYRERYGDISKQAPPQNFQQQTAQPQNLPPQIQSPKFDANVISQIDDAITQRALAISGLSKEDVEGIDYLEDDDPKISLWNHARKLSEASVYNDIIANHVAQQQELQRMRYLQNQSVNDYNNYVAQKQAAENFEAVKQYATNEYFNAQSPIDKEVITTAFSRATQNMATPADLMILRNFFASAEMSYANRAAIPQAQTPQSPQPKVNFPRTNQLNGSAGNGGGVTQAQLAEMLQNRKWSEIPLAYQKKLLGL